MIDPTGLVEPIVPGSATAPELRPPGRAARLAAHLRDPLHRNSYALVVSGALTSVFGLLYWVLVARNYTEQQVGLGAAAVSAMVLLANAAGLGLQNGLVRFVPAAGSDTRRFVLRSLALAAGVAVVLAGVFVVGLSWWAPDLAPLLRESPWTATGFVAATAVWILFVLQDNALIGLRRATVIPVENLVFSVAKIVLVLVLAGVAPRWGVFASWPLAAAGAVCCILGVVLPRLLADGSHAGRPSTLPPRRELRRHLAGEHFSVMLWLATIETIPLVVLHRLGAATNAHYSLATQIVYGLMILPAAVSVAFTAESAGNPHLLHQHLRRSARNIVNLLVPAVTLVVVFAPVGLRVFGPGYTVAGDTLRLMALSTLPYAVTLLFTNVARVQRRTRDIAVIYTVLCGLLAGLGLVLMDRYGLIGLGVAWLVAQTVVAIGILATQLPKVGVRGHVSVVSSLSAGAGQARALRRAAGRLRGVPGRITELGTVRTTDVLAARPDLIVALVRSKEHGPQVLKVAQTPAGDACVHRAVAAIDDVRLLASMRPYVPEIRALGDIDGRAFSVEEHRSGDTALERLRVNQLGLRSLEQTVGVLGELHTATARRVVVDHEWLRRWVHGPLDRVAEATTAPPVITGTAALRRRLVEELSGRTVVVARIHGDPVPANVLLELQTGALGALTGWRSSAADGLPELDVLRLLAGLSTARGVTDAAAIAMLATPEGWSYRDRAIAGAAQASFPNAALSPWALATLTWLAGLDDAVVARSGGDAAARVEREIDQVALALVALPAGVPLADRPAGAAAPTVPAARRATPTPLPTATPTVEPTPGARPARRTTADLVPRPVAAVLRPRVVIPVAVVAWFLALRGIDLESMTDIGLLSVLGPTAFVALGVLLASVVAGLSAPVLRTGRIAPPLVAFLVLVHGTPAFLYGSLRYSWAWKHVGLVDFILRTGTVDREVRQLAVYHQWPGFFSAAATLTDVVGADNALTIATWSPLFFNLVLCIVLVFLFDALTSDRRVVWLATTLYFVTTWVGQDYFAPQAYTFVLHLGVIAMVLQRFPHDRGNQLGRSWRPGPTAGIIAAGVVVIVTSHQLTPVMLIASLVALAVFRQARSWRFALFAVVVMALWSVTWSRPFVSTQVEGIVDRLGSVADNTGRTLADTARQSSGQALVSTMGRGAIALIALLAGLGAVRRFWRGHRDWTALVLAGTPVSILFFNDYGGEVLFRVVLFAMPFLAYFAAQALSAPNGLWSNLRRIVTLGAVAALLVGFLFGYYGKERQYYFTSEEIGAVDHLETVAPDNTLLVVLNSNYPNLVDRYERFTVVPVTYEDEFSINKIFADPAAVMERWLDNPDYAATYLFISRSQLIETSDLGEVPLDSVLQLVEEVRDSPAFESVYSTDDATVYRLARPVPSPQESS